MKRVIVSLALALGTSLAAGQAAPAAAAAPLPAAVFFADPRVGAVALSPDGTAVAMAAQGPAGRLQLVLVDLQSMKPRPLAGFNDAHVGHVEWLNDDEIAFRAQPLFYVGAPIGAPGGRGSGLYVVRRDGSAPARTVIGWDERAEGELVDRVNVLGVILLADVGPQRGRWQYLLEPDPMPNDRPTVDWRLARLDLGSLEVERLDAPRSLRDVVLDAAGQARMALRATGDRATLQLRGREGWREALGYRRFAGEDIVPRHAGPDGRLFVTAPDSRGFAALYTVDPEAGRLSDAPLLALDGFDVEPQFVADDRRTLGLRLRADAEVTQWWDEGLQRLQAEVDARLPGMVNRLVPPRRGDGGTVLVRSGSDQQPTRWFVYRRADRRLVLLGAAQPQIGAAEVARMGQTDFVRVPARDGLPIPVYVTRPAGAAADQKLPVLLWVRSRPDRREGDWAWRAEWQFLASRGYLVVAPELRGASGFGRRHQLAGHREWGRATQDDLMDVLRWAGEQGGGDARRACVGGFDWGGYTALVAALRDAASLRCAFAFSPIVDLRGMYDEERWAVRDEYVEQWLPRMLGDPRADAERLDAVSPLRQAQRIAVPVLLGQSQGRPGHQRVLVQRLRSQLDGRLAGFEWVGYAEDNGTLMAAETRIDFWTRVEAFLARHNPAR
jgi:dipeptidyl aminopeptidase/acylaminoacyl peptidase